MRDMVLVALTMTTVTPPEGYYVVPSRQEARWLNDWWRIHGTRDDAPWRIVVWAKDKYCAVECKAPEFTETPRHDWAPLLETHLHRFGGSAGIGHGYNLSGKLPIAAGIELAAETVRIIREMGGTL